MPPLEKLGPYKLDKVLGRGGMGSVYVGVNEATGQRAAVKVLASHLSDDSTFRERFKSEVETLKKLLHPNIVRLFAFGEEEGHLYYVMELVEGRSLQDELAAGRRFTWREVAKIGIDVAAALKHAHDRGIVHRDLKPANLMIDSQDHIKLTDFGIAKLYGGTNITADGGVIGTADYMAPEQAEGKPVTGRCDLYSLGSVLHALLTGRPPFAGKNVLEVIQALRTEKPVPVRRICHEVPEELEAIILQLLEKDPRKRMPTAIATANRLKAMEHALSLETRIGLPDDGELRLAPEPPASRPSLHSAPTGSPLSNEMTAELPADSDYRLSGEMPTIVTSGTPAATPSLATGASIAAGSHSPATRRSLDGTSVGASASSATPASRAAHFTTVSEAELRNERASHDDSGAGQWIKIALLCVGAVVVFGGVLFYATRAPSADALSARIAAAADKGDSQKLVEASSDIEQFLTLYPNDPRAAEMRAHQDEVELYQLQRRFDLRARRNSGAELLSPVERAYLDAQRFVASDPQEALRRFEAIVDVYGGDDTASDSLIQRRLNQQCIELAKKQIERIRETAPALEAEQLALLQAQLKRAADLAKRDQAGATRVWQGIITLYADKAWAAEAVAEARSRLAP